MHKLRAAWYAHGGPSTANVVTGRTWGRRRAIPTLQGIEGRMESACAVADEDAGVCAARSVGIGARVCTNARSVLDALPPFVHRANGTVHLYMLLVVYNKSFPSFIASPECKNQILSSPTYLYSPTACNPPHTQVK